MKTEDSGIKVSRKGIANTFAKDHGELYASVAPKQDDRGNNEKQQKTSNIVNDEERDEKPIQTSKMRPPDHSRNEPSASIEQADRIFQFTTI